MARRLDSQSKGWQNYSKPIGRLEAFERYTDYRDEKIKTMPDEDECIYYPVYGQGDKLKIVTNPLYGPYSKSQSKPNPQSPLMKSSTKENKNIDYGTGENGYYEILRSTVSQSSPPLKHQLASRSRDLHAPVSRSTLRALRNDFQPNKHGLMTFEPTVDCRQSHPRENCPKNNNYIYECPKTKKSNDAGESRFVSPHFDNSLIQRDDSDELLDYCTCMCFVKGAFYHFTKDSEDEGHIADQPCSCAGPLSHCVPRWGCLGIFALFLPCLWCYLPLKGCKKINQSPKCSINSPGVQSGK